ncbi:hypothetical protein KLP40_07445 [Hymenobacter sp. NST-14]|uniref:hypothetical protein n=1 Tax=Hymenobacter piscis TaxID=2839984 RepID=UPI001C019720|nr:hypothetical protein [Hymenobacter piscis]MBT9392992.1 hypothetical protein [Hymenobacter piscis]
MTFSLAAVRAWKPARGLQVGLNLFLQALVIGKAFRLLLFEPGRHLLSNLYDGAKNYFTFQAYVQQPWENGLRWFGLMNYPYGEYIFYTDNTPLLAVAVRLWSHYLFDLRPYALDVYHGLLLSGFLLSTLLLTLILRRFVRHWGLITIFSVALPWLNPQVSRLLVGHLNLSFSWVLLLAIWGLLNVYERARAGQPVRRWVAGLVIGFTLTGFLHLYYLPLLAVLTGGFFAWWLLPRHRWWSAPSLTVAGGALTLGPMALCVAIIRLVDGYYPQRGKGAAGFDYEPWKLQVSALFRSPEHNVINFWLEPNTQPTYESVAYLGAFALFGATLLLAWWLSQPAARKAGWSVWQTAPAWPFLRLLLGAALVSLLIAVGTTYTLDEGKYTLHNYLNLFFYGKKITEAVTQFRVLARFSWVFFWAVNLLFVVGLDFWLSKSKWPARWLLAVGLVALAVVDTRDAVKHYTYVAPNVLTNPEFTPEVNTLLYSLEPENYQALLPIPYFHVGSEDMERTLDDYDQVSRYAYQITLRTNLPMLASKMSRTPPQHLLELRSLFLPDGPTPALRARLQQPAKPVLVLYDASFYDGTNPVIAQQTKPQVREILDAGADFPQRQHLTLLAEAGSLRLYRWDL